MNPTIKHAVSEFCAAAVEKGDFAEESRDHSLHAAMSKAVASLRSAGSAGTDALRSLLAHESPHVRCWVASELLAAGELSARPVLESLAAMPGLVGLSAATVLREHMGGRLRSPFGNDEA